ncbi:MAG: hypothetical protein LBG76_00945 [Treponema sp.]|jgi:tetratricopeptide (TPR) repeat protein|nr:hypothetical protein [Treponema sp.]
MPQRKRSVLVFLLLVPLCMAVPEPSHYTYNYDQRFNYVYSPDAYRVADYLLGADLGIGNFLDPQGLFIRDNRLYVCDSGNNRIVVLEIQEEGCELKNVVYSVEIDGVESPFNSPRDIFETENGDLYIADTNNSRILVLNRDWSCRSVILQPDDETIDAEAEFIPSKLVVDSAGRLYLQAANVNKGLMEFDPQGNFVGYMGANKVLYNAIDYVWKLISTKAQRAQMQLFIPTEYSNLYLDPEEFIYVTSQSIATRTSSNIIYPVRRLNAVGEDILFRIENFAEPMGDMSFSNNSELSASVRGASRFIDVTAFDNGVYACFDRTRGRIFVYDFQANLLYAFGGVGGQEGYFTVPAALDHWGYSLFALDSRSGAVTRFELTRYGETVNAALGAYKRGRYEESAALWEEALRMNGNYDLAYIGLGRAAFLQGDYKTAMKYFKLKRQTESYGEAFQYYRKEWMERNIWWIILALIALIVAPPLIRIILKLRKEVLET